MSFLPAGVCSDTSWSPTSEYMDSEKVDRCEPEQNEVFGDWNCPWVAIGDRSFVLNRKNKVLCFVRVAKLRLRERGSFVLNRNWRFGGRSTQGRLAGSTGKGALERPQVRFEIFTDSSSSCGARNAKRCVCTSLVPGEEHDILNKLLHLSQRSHKRRAARQPPEPTATEPLHSLRIVVGY